MMSCFLDKDNQEDSLLEYFTLAAGSGSGYRNERRKEKSFTS